MTVRKTKNQQTAEVVQKNETRARSKAVVCDNMSYAAREAFKRLRTNVVISFPQENRKCRVIGITSALPTEGKSSVAINLAYSLAELGKNVAVVDGDMRRSSIHEKLGFRQAPGLADLLTGESTVGRAMLEYRSEEERNSFRVITGGNTPKNPSELLNSEQFEKLLKSLESSFDYIILDLPPINAVVDAVNAAALTDGMIVVIRENFTPRHVLSDCVEQLTYAKANILGFVMNGSLGSAGKRYKYGNGYYKYGYYKYGTESYYGK